VLLKFPELAADRLKAPASKGTMELRRTHFTPKELRDDLEPNGIGESNR
jgi:hypothetical protein